MSRVDESFIRFSEHCDIKIKPRPVENNGSKKQVAPKNRGEEAEGHSCSEDIGNKCLRGILDVGSCWQYA